MVEHPRCPPGMHYLVGNREETNREIDERAARLKAADPYDTDAYIGHATANLLDAIAKEGERIVAEAPADFPVENVMRVLHGGLAGAISTYLVHVCEVGSRGVLGLQFMLPLMTIVVDIMKAADEADTPARGEPQQ